MRVGVVGAGGRMGREVCRAVAARAGLELVAAVDPAAAGTTVGELTGGTVDGATGGLVVAPELEALTAADVEVVVDFTHLDVSRVTVAFCADRGIHTVVGTTGYDQSDIDELRGRFSSQGERGANCILAANFAIGAVLMMRFAAMAAPWFDGAEIVELHHDAKRDAPSGTAMRTAEGMAAARAAAGRSDYPPDATTTVVVEGARGGAGPGGVRMHAVRLPGLVAHQEVLLGSTGQGLTIRHDSYDRVSFMDGVVLAVESVAHRPGLTLGIEPLLGI